MFQIDLFYKLLCSVRLFRYFLECWIGMAYTEYQDIKMKLTSRYLLTATWSFSSHERTIAALNIFTSIKIGYNSLWLIQPPFPQSNSCLCYNYSRKFISIFSMKRYVVIQTLPFQEVGGKLFGQGWQAYLSFYKLWEHSFLLIISMRVVRRTIAKYM